MNMADVSMTENNVPLVATVTLRVIMQGKEVGSIIGKKGETIKKFRTDSGCKINISDNSSVERIVTFSGSTESIYKAFTLISGKFESDLAEGMTTSAPKPPVTLRLVVPASQCGSLIGKGGAKIKEIREKTGASVQVAGDYLPNSTERAVTVSGTPDAITDCVQQICHVLLESPPKGATVPYKPKPNQSPMIMATNPGNTGGHYPPGMPGQMPMSQPDISKLHQLAMQQQATLLHVPLVGANLSSTTVGSNGTSTTNELNIPNDLIGCIIGPGGARINEIRNLSGATIKIAPLEQGSTDRNVSITGTPEAVNMAQFLINSSQNLPDSLQADPYSGADDIRSLVDPDLDAASYTTADVPEPPSSPGPLCDTPGHPVPLMDLQLSPSSVHIVKRPGLNVLALKRSTRARNVPY